MPYPSTAPRPISTKIVAVICDNQVLLAHRANPPGAARWRVPGGKTTHGKTRLGAATRGLAQETGVSAEPLRAFTAVNAFPQDATGTVDRDFIPLAVSFRRTAGEPVAGDDAPEAQRVDLEARTETSLAPSLDVMEAAERVAAPMSEVPS